VGKLFLGKPEPDIDNEAVEYPWRLASSRWYFCWVGSYRIKKIASDTLHDEQEATITFGKSPSAALRVVAQNLSTLRVIHGIEESMPLFDTKLRVMIIAFLRPSKSNHTTVPIEIAVALRHDRDMAVVSLSHER
jgi:hypothetical protein